MIWKLIFIDMHLHYSKNLHQSPTTQISLPFPETTPKKILESIILSFDYISGNI